jgi:hypothetical protein
MMSKILVETCMPRNGGLVITTAVRFHVLFHFAFFNNLA